MIGNHELAKIIADRYSTDEHRVYIRDCREWIEVIFETLTDLVLEGEEVHIGDFGRFFTKKIRIAGAKPVPQGTMVKGDAKNLPAFYRTKLKFKTSLKLDEYLKKRDLEEEKNK